MEADKEDLVEMRRKDRIEKLQITKLRKTCEACPAQWEGEDSKGNPIYIRFRWGYLSIRQEEKGEDIMSAIDGKEIFGEKLSDGLDGSLSFEELKNAAKSRLIEIEWPEKEE